ncbi:hypothetical protein FGI60_09575 [Brucella haematophila]|nr:hypothetical protein F9K79_08615 [Ochrobactrum sp. Kaboul]TMV03435.1 hypothetical protein FGI60_09575 [Brucella haematophila]
MARQLQPAIIPPAPRSHTFRLRCGMLSRSPTTSGLNLAFELRLSKTLVQTSNWKNPLESYSIW